MFTYDAKKEDHTDHDSCQYAIAGAITAIAGAITAIAGAITACPRAADQGAANEGAADGLAP